MSFADWLKSVSSTHIGTRNVICVTTSTTIKEAFEVLYSNHILSCPVVDASKSAIGMVDLLDIVTFVVNFLGENQDQEHFNKHWESVKGSEAFCSTTVEKIIDLSGKNKLVTMPHDSTLYDVCKVLSEGTHRVWITDPEGRLHRLVTQSAILGYLCSVDNNAPLGLFEHLTLEQSKSFHLSSPSLYSVHTNEPAINAFHKMKDGKVGAVAVVDESGALVSNLSARDLRAMKTFNYYMFSTLFKSVREFISIVRQEELKTRVPAISCVPGDSVSSTLRRLVGIRVHQLWIKDAHNKPTGIVSTSDLIAFLVSH